MPAPLPAEQPVTHTELMLRAAASLLLILYAPGAVLFRLPVLERPRRAALEAEERVYWVVVISGIWSSVVVFGLAAVGSYRFERLLVINAVGAALLAAAVRGRLRLEQAPRVTASAAVPVLVALLSAYMFVPPSEYILGGKDPGVYINEGIQIAQRGSIITNDAVIKSVPPPFRDLFFPSYKTTAYYSLRFMGFFIKNPDDGSVVGQFPHLFPSWIAIGYGINGLTGALYVLAGCAIAGVLGVYFVGARLLGRSVAGVAAALLSISIVQVWFARYPNAEMLAQAILMAGLLAFARSHVDQDPFFEPVAGVLLGLLLFARIDAILAVAAVVATALMLRIVGVSLRAAFLAPLILLSFGALAYFVTVLSPYAALPLFILNNPTWFQIGMSGGVIVLVLVVYVLSGMPAIAPVARVWLPRILAIVVVAAAAYAYFLREPGGKLAFHDANSLRMFTWYLHPAGLAAALIGFVLIAWRKFWYDPALLVTAAVYGLFVFYKIQIVPEHFWMARRFVMIIMPAALLLAAAATLMGFTAQLMRPARPGSVLGAGDRFTRIAIRLAVLGLLSATLLQSTRPILAHVEYAGVIPRVEALSKRFDERDLVIVESRNASDLHVLALPLAYIYARNVLVLNSPKPDKSSFAAFLDWARGPYRDVYFIGGGGTDLLSRRIGVDVVGDDRFQVPEYESLRNAYPTHVRQKEFDFGIYRFVRPQERVKGFTLNVGTRDDLNVVRFHAKERNGDHSFRWTRPVSYVSVLGIDADTASLSIMMENGGRPPGLPPATVQVLLNDRALGQVTVGTARQAYSFAIPPDLAATAAKTDDAALLKLVSSTWNPRAVLGANDDRDLGVMVDRIEVH